VGQGRGEDDHAPAPGLRRNGGSRWPHGPAFKAKLGAALIAQRSGALIVPTAAACNRKIELHKRWDTHVVPLPFSRTLVHFGTPIDSCPAFGAKPELEDLRARLELALEMGTAQANAALEHAEPGSQFRAVAPGWSPK
jgi:1-acyl-sn-glycerol-3-phosphate acyltransferase